MRSAQGPVPARHGRRSAAASPLSRGRASRRLLSGPKRVRRGHHHRGRPVADGRLPPGRQHGLFAHRLLAVGGLPRRHQRNRRPHRARRRRAVVAVRRRTSTAPGSTSSIPSARSMRVAANRALVGRRDRACIGTGSRRSRSDPDGDGAHGEGQRHARRQVRRLLDDPPRPRRRHLDGVRSVIVGVAGNCSLKERTVVQIGDYGLPLDPARR